ncbi:MAG TPA: phosphomannomutase [Solibacterales bacterium]|nr:phosphomannomutase [Bryobacterales bacterium]
MLNPTIFREYDIRGIADVDLPSDGVRGLGQAMGTYLRRNGGPNVCLGRDTRESSPRLRDAIAHGLQAAGCQVTDIGVVPTPVLYYAVRHLGAAGGVMITGSHNPADYNGFKTVCGASTIYGAAIQELLRILQTGDFETGAGSLHMFDAVTPYVDEIARQFSFPRRIKVVADGGNGVAGPPMEKLLARLNVDAVPLFFDMDGKFPNHHPDPTEEKNLVDLKNAVAEHQADLGIAFDGDADRLGAIDEQGHVVWGDMLMLIFGREILTRKPGATFIGEVKCSQVMYDELERLGGKPIMYKTGHSLIKAKMKEEHAELAGEMSGHMFFADRYYGYDDALYAACRLMEIVSNSGRPLSAQLAGVPRMVVTPELRVDCPDHAKFGVVRQVLEHFRGRRKVVEVDGARVLFEKGWGLVRASNTQPVLVMRFEAETPELLDEYRREVEAALPAIP